jgi:ABC-type transport system substrate-binding protein
MVPNTEYWDKARIPKQDRLVLIPMPEALTRTAALLSGQVNWIEAPSPDAIPRLKSEGMRIVTNVYPHDWPYMLNCARGPFQDLRVRQAANYAINRQDVVDMLARSMHERNTSAKRKFYCSRFDCSDGGWTAGIDLAAAGLGLCIG